MGTLTMSTRINELEQEIVRLKRHLWYLTIFLAGVLSSMLIKILFILIK